MLNYTPVKNKPIRIMKAMRDPHARRSGVGNVFVKVRVNKCTGGKCYDENVLSRIILQM